MKRGYQVILAGVFLQSLAGLVAAFGLWAFVGVVIVGMALVAVGVFADLD